METMRQAHGQTVAEQLAHAFELQRRHAANLAADHAARGPARPVRYVPNYYTPSISETGPHLDNEPELHFSTIWPTTPRHDWR